MKKTKNLIFLLLALTLLCSVFILASCNSANNNVTNENISPPASQDLLAPFLTSFVDYLSWNRTSHATEYEVYCDDILIGSTKEDTYPITDFSADHIYQIVACNSTTGKRSLLSNAVTVSKHSNFAEGEILDLSNFPSYSGNIASNVRKVIIGKESASAFQLYAVIQEREHDLIFSLNNVTITGQDACITTYNDTFSAVDHSYNVVFNITGNCTLNGNKGYEWTHIPADDSESNGRNGGKGATALIGASFIVRGDGNLTVKGGNGGNGSNGSATTAHSDKVPGKGSNGGDGGTGVCCQYFVVNMSATSVVSIQGGKGGAKGLPGSNASIVTGPIVSLMWKDIYDIGIGGKDGKALQGIAVEINGTLNY